jgi:hypothetical protein
MFWFSNIVGQFEPLEFVQIVKGGLDRASAKKATIQIGERFDGRWQCFKFDENAYGLFGWPIGHLIKLF